MINILIVDDHVMVRRGIASCLQEIDYSVRIFHAKNCKEAFSLIRKCTDIDLVLMDLLFRDDEKLPEKEEGIECLTELKNHFPALYVVIYTAIDVTEERVRDCLRKGAAGFISKAAGEEEFIYALQSVLSEKVYLPPFMAGGESNVLSKKATAFDLSNILTPTEMRICRDLVLFGDCYKTMAKRLGYTTTNGDQAIKNHMTNITRKLNIKTRDKLIIQLFRWGYGFK